MQIDLLKLRLRKYRYSSIPDTFNKINGEKAILPPTIEELIEKNLHIKVPLQIVRKFMYYATNCNYFMNLHDFRNYMKPTQNDDTSVAVTYDIIETLTLISDILYMECELQDIIQECLIDDYAYMIARTISSTDFVSKSSIRTFIENNKQIPVRLQDHIWRRLSFNNERYQVGSTAFIDFSSLYSRDYLRCTIKEKNYNIANGKTNTIEKASPIRKAKETQNEIKTPIQKVKEAAPSGQKIAPPTQQAQPMRAMVQQAQEKNEPVVVIKSIQDLIGMQNYNDCQTTKTIPVGRCDEVKQSICNKLNSTRRAIALTNVIGNDNYKNLLKTDITDISETQRLKCVNGCVQYIENSIHNLEKEI